MRIAFVTIGFAPNRTSGLDVSGERLVGALLAAGHEVCVVAGATGPLIEQYQHPQLEIQRVRVGRSNWIAFAYRAAQRVSALQQAQPFDVVHFWDIYFAYAFRGTYLASLQHSFRQRWATWDREHASAWISIYHWAYYSLARRLVEQPALTRAAGLLAASATGRQEYALHYGVDPGRMALARHGIDTQFFQPRPASAALRARYGLAPDETVALFVGFVTRRKGLEYLARALQLVPASVRLLVAGRWSQQSRARFVEVLGSAAERLIEAGFVADEEMPELYSLANVYVSASLLEGFGLPLAEALACGTPVVAAEAGSVAEVVGPGGILVPPRNPAGLAAAISRLVDDPQLARSLGQLGRAHIVAQFSLERMRDDTLAAYRHFGFT